MKTPEPRKLPPPGRKLTFQEAKAHAFSKYAKDLQKLARS